MNPTKVAILLEMSVLFGGSLVLARSSEPDWWHTIIHETRTAVGIVIVSAVLLTLDDLGAGPFAASFGGLATLGYLLGASGALGPQLLNLEKQYLGSATPSQKGS